MNPTNSQVSALPYAAALVAALLTGGPSLLSVPRNPTLPSYIFAITSPSHQAHNQFDAQHRHTTHLETRTAHSGYGAVGAPRNRESVLG